MKKLKLMHVNPKQTAKVCAFLYVFLGGIYVLIGSLMAISDDAEIAAEGVGLLIVGLLLPLMGFVIVWAMMALMNWVMKKCGGITFTVQEEKK